uniref:triadin-like isoform X2 n=1 Tax=Erigeron canadensis TaxID=72917 RepID=UPI001CB8B5AA|nr:triadin-like isoform X2 [Erigeron canadensis]
MVFWGIEVKPGNPYTHKFILGGGRLRISQATLAIGTATLRSSVQCNVGDKRPVLLCALLPNKNESLQLDLEFDEADDIVFSVIGPRAVYLTGYYVGHNRLSNMQDESESYGEDIANSETQESNHCSDEDEYEDSFINDDEPEPLTPSPVSSVRDDDEENIPKKKHNLNGGHKRLKKRYQSIESDDELIVQEIDEDDDLPISSICKNDKSRPPGKRTNKKTTADVEKVKKDKDDQRKLKTVSSPVPGSKDTADVDLMDVKEEGVGHSNTAEAILEKKLKTRNISQDSAKEEKASDVLAAKDDQKPKDDEHKLKTVSSVVLGSNDTVDVDLMDVKEEGKVSHSNMDEVIPEKKSKTRKKRQDSSKEEKATDVLAAKDDQKLKDNEHKLKAVGSPVLGSKDMVDVDLMDVKEGKVGHSNTAEVIPEKKSKTRKKKQDSSKEEKTTDVLAAKDDQKPKDDEHKLKTVGSPVLGSKDTVDADMMDVKEEGKVGHSNTAEVIPEKKSKTRKKKQDSFKEEKATDVLAAKDDQKLKDYEHLLKTVGSPYLDSKDTVDVDLMDVKEEGKMGHSNTAEVIPEKKSKTKKKRQGSSIEEKATDVLAPKDDQKPNDTKIVDPSLEVLDSAGGVPDKNLKPKKKRKGRSEVSTDATNNNLLAGNKQEDDQQATEKSSCVNPKQIVDENGSEEKKDKKKRRKTSKTNEVEQNMDVEKETRPSTVAPESCKEKILSNGLVIEDLVTSGKSEGKVAAAGRKVKVNYVVKLKENGIVIDSNGKSPYKFRLGDKEVLEGLNVGLDGMRVGDKRRLTIPPSMSSGYKGTGENIPPSSWLVYDVEMTSIH